MDAHAVKSPVNWLSNQSHWMWNPRLPLSSHLPHKAPDLPAHIWIRSSGTTRWNESRWVALSKSAFLASAQAVNDHLSVTRDDIWLKCLPDFHVGGLSIFARSHLLSNTVVELKTWSPATFVKAIQQFNCTLSALVPTQVYDLVRAKLQCPSSLRAIIVGGDALTEPVYKAARSLDWPLLPSYGMTECCSQVATAELSSLTESCYPKIRLLNHIKASVTKEGFLTLKSPALLSGELFEGKNGITWKPRSKDEEFVANDRVELKDGYLLFLGRPSDTVKVLGELVSLKALREKLTEFVLQRNLELSQWHIQTVPHARKGMDLVLVTEKWSPVEAGALIYEFNKQVAPFERITSFYWLKKIPRTDLGKIHEAKLLHQLRY